MFTENLAKLILITLGWNLPSDDHLIKINSNLRTIMVFSHTSYADFFLFILIMTAYPKETKYFRTLVIPGPFEYMGKFLRSYGAIPATVVDEKNGGAVKRIVQELLTKERSVFLISPKGTIVNRPWRSGYYAIAKELDGFLCAAGMDYEKKEIVISDCIHQSEGEDNVKEFLMKELGEIVPYFPEEEVMPIRKHNWWFRGFTSWRFWLIISGLIYYFRK
jgi:hypothetical protein